MDGIAATRFFKVLFVSLIGMILCGCLPSLNPLSTKNDCEIEGLSGTWTNNNDGRKAIYQVGLKNGKYHIVGKSRDEKGNEDVGYYDITISKVGNDLYANVILNKKTFSEWPSEIEHVTNWYMIPFYWIFKIKRDGDTLSLLVYEGGQKAPPTLNTIENGGVKIFAADSQALRRWLVTLDEKSFKSSPGFVFKKSK